MNPARLSQIPFRHDDSLVFGRNIPERELDADLQQVDLAQDEPAGVLRMGEIPTTEMLAGPTGELSSAPFVLCNRLYLS